MKTHSILQITPTYWPTVGGLEDVVRCLSAAMVAAGWKCDIAELKTSNRGWCEDFLDGSRVFRVPLHGHRLMGLSAGLMKLTRHYDILHVHDPQLLAVTANAFLFGAGKPLALSTHGGFFHTDNYSLVKRLHKRFTGPAMLSLYDVVLASSESDFATFKKLSDRVMLVQNGVGVSRFENIARNSPPDFKRWIYWGRFSANKRLNQVIRYLAGARKRGIDANLKICGRDFDGVEPSLKRLIRELDLGTNVEIIDSPSDEALEKLIAQSSVFITASQFEGFGLSVVEAMAAGLPIICRNIEPLNGFVKIRLTTVSFCRLMEPSPTLMRWRGSYRSRATIIRR